MLIPSRSWVQIPPSLLMVPWCKGEHMKLRTSEKAFESFRNYNKPTQKVGFFIYIIIISRYISLMIKKNLKEHSMGIWVKLPVESMILRRWFLKINDVYFYVKLESEHLTHNGFPVSVRNTPTSPSMCLNPNQLEIKLVDSTTTSAEFLRDWMTSDRKLDVTLERLDLVGQTLEKWQLYGSFIQEMHHEVVYDRTIGDITVPLLSSTIRINYDYANLIF